MLRHLQLNALLSVLLFFTLTSYALADSYLIGNLRSDDRLNVRTGPSTKYAIVHKLPAGASGFQKVECIDTQKSRRSIWCKIKDENKTYGWVNAYFLLLDRQTYQVVEPQTDATDGLPLFRGYRSVDDFCQSVGENELTGNYLDHTADLVACPKGSEALSTFLTQFGNPSPAFSTTNYHVFSIPTQQIGVGNPVPIGAPKDNGEQIVQSVPKELINPRPHLQDLVLTGGFRSADDPCRIAGESALTRNLLDNNTYLIACPKTYSGLSKFIAESGNPVVELATTGYYLYRIPR